MNDKARVTCNCKVCHGASALVPNKMLAEAGTPTAIHNYVSMAIHLPSAARFSGIEKV